MEATPVSLLERLRRPDQAEAWGRFVDLYGPVLYAWARRFGLQEADAADLVQDVLLLLTRKLPEFQYDPSKKFRAWLWTLARNEWVRGRVLGKFSASAGNEGLSDAAVEDGLVEVAEQEYRQVLVARALQVMQSDFQPPTWRACWQLVVDGRPAAEVARELGMTVAAAYAAKARVLRRLRQELAELLD
jgi:RNA polymerase sigma-70 factor (ECF subfamily)